MSLVDSTNWLLIEESSETILDSFEWEIDLASIASSIDVVNVSIFWYAFLLSKLASALVDQLAHAI